MIRLIYVNQVDVTEATGQGFHEREMTMNLLSDPDIEGHLITPEPALPSPVDDLPRVWFLPLKKKGFGYLAYQLRLFSRLWILTREKKETVLFVRLSPAMLAPALISILRRIPMVVRSCEILRSLETHGKSNSPLVRGVIYFTSFLHLYFAKKIIVVTTTIRDYVTEEFKIPLKRIIISGNGCNPDIFRILPESETKCSDLSLPEGKPVLFAGYISFDYGIDDFIQALILLRKRDNLPISAILLGDGPLRDELIELVKKEGLDEFIFFAGRVDQVTLNRYLNCCQVAVVPFKKELYKRCGSSALKLFEYLASGIRVLATHHEDHLFFEENEIGKLCQPNNPEDMAAVLKKMLEEPVQKGEKEKRRNYVLATSTWALAYKRIKTVCVSCLPSKIRKEVREP